MLSPRRYATAVAAIALAVLGTGVAAAELTTHAAAAVVVPADASLTPGSAWRVGTDVPYLAADRPGASDVPRVHPLNAGEMYAVHAA